MPIARTARTYQGLAVDHAFDVAVDEEPGDGPHLWPSVGEYPVYDPFLYYLMTHDGIRNDSFRGALRAAADGRAVLDVGTGQDMVWALEAARHGARRVMAIERMEETFAEASRLLATLPEAALIQLRCCTSFELKLDEPAEVCVAEIIGNIGSSEGMLAAMADAHSRLLTPGAVVVPAGCATLAGAVSLRAMFPAGPAFAAHTVPYLDSIFESCGRPFDVRLGVAYMDPASVISNAGIVEDLAFDGSSPLDEVTTAELTMLRAGEVDGIVFWIRLDVGGGTPIVDSLADQTSWIPIYFPLFDTPIPVAAGDVLAIEFERSTTEDCIHPDYLVRGELTTSAGSFRGSHSSPHHDAPLGTSAVHRELFGLD